MCYNSQDSLNAYLINLVSSIILFNKSSNTDMKIASIFFLFVGQMQILDYIFWKNTKCESINKLTTKIAILFNHLQPIVLFLLFNYYNYEQTNISKIILLLYTLFIIDYTIKLWPEKNCEIKINEKVCCSLPLNDLSIIKWKWNEQQNSIFIYTLFLLYLFTAGFNLKNSKYKYLFSIASISSILIALKIPKLNISVGRVWCYLASFVPIFFLLV
jgi:hypothetical protein